MQACGSHKNVSPHLLIQECDPQKAHLHPVQMHTQATLPIGCPQYLTAHSRCHETDPFWQGAVPHQWAIWHKDSPELAKNLLRTEPHLGSSHPSLFPSRAEPAHLAPILCIIFSTHPCFSCGLPLLLFPHWIPSGCLSPKESDLTWCPFTSTPFFAYTSDSIIRKQEALPCIIHAKTRTRNQKFQFLD